MYATSRPAPLLPTQLAFVVQFAAETAEAHRSFAGRVKHVVSGQARRFHSPEELLAWLTHMLTTLGPQPPEAP